MDSPLLPDQLDAATMCQPLQAHPRRSWFSCWRMKSIQGTRSRLDWDNVKISVNICQQVKFEMNRWDRWDHTNWWFWYVSVVEAEEVGSNSKSMLGCLYVAQCVSLWNLLAGMSCVDIVAASLTPHRPLIEGQPRFRNYPQITNYDSPTIIQNSNNHDSTTKIQQLACAI